MPTNGNRANLIRIEVDRRLGHEWDEWDGQPLPRGGNFASPPGQFFRYAALTLAVVAAAAYLAAYLLDPGYVTRSEPRYLDVQTAWGRFYGATIPLDRRVAPEATPVEVAVALDFKRVFALYKELLTRAE